jgi:hypothetical protein
MTVPSDDAVEARALTFADIIKITDKIAENEGAEAADIAFQRMARKYREAQARKAEDSVKGSIISSIEDLELVLGDLEVGAGETAAEVIEHLGELDASIKDAAEAKHQAHCRAMLAAYSAANAAAKAAAKAEARLVREPTRALRPDTATPAVQAVAVAEKAERTDIEDFDLDFGDLESLDACIEGTARAKAVEAMLAELGADELDASAEDTPKTESSVAATPAATDGPNDATLNEAAAAEKGERTDIDLNLVLADLEVGVGEPGYGKVIEHLDEPDASAEDAVEGAIAVAEAYEDQSDEPTALTVAIQEYKTRQSTRGEARPAACKDFGIDVADPQALDKVRTAFRLKRFGKALADLEAYHPGFWALPLETDDRSASRKLVLSRFLWNRETEIERQKKREAKIAARGLPPDYYEWTPAKRRTFNNCRSKQKSRERAKTLAAAEKKLTGPEH